MSIGIIPAHPPAPATSFTVEDATTALVDGNVLGPPVGARVPAQGSNERPTLPATALQQVLVRAPTAGMAHPAGVRLRGLRITGQLDLRRARLLSPLTVEDCHFDEPILLEDAAGGSIEITDSRLRGLQGDGLQLRSSMDLHGCTSEAEVRLAGAHIAGQLNLGGLRILAGVGQAALTAHLIQVDKGILLTEGFHCEGQASLENAHVGQFLSLHGATFHNGEGYALLLTDARIEGQLSASSALAIEGTMNMARAHVADVELLDVHITAADGLASLEATGVQCAGSLSIGSASSVLQGRLELDRATAARVVLSGEIRAEADASDRTLALSAVGLTVKESVHIDESLQVHGWIDARKCSIDGDLDLAGLRVALPDVTMWALVLSGSSVGGALRLSDPFSVVGAVDLEGVTVDRDLLLGGTWDAGRTMALRGRRAKIGGSVLLQPALDVRGALSLPDSQIGGDLVLAGQFGGRGLTALNVSGAHVQGSVMAAPTAAEHTPTSPQGQLHFEGLRCDGSVNLSAITCGQTDATDPVPAVLLGGAQIGGSLYMLEPFVASPGGVSLDRARVGGTVNARGGRFGADGGSSLSAEGLVCGNLLLDDAQAEGRIKLVDARCAGLSLRAATVRGGLSCRRLKVAGPAYLCPDVLTAPVDLAYADVRVLRVNRVLLHSSPDLQEFGYAAIEGGAPDDYRQMLPRDGRFAAQPYEQLAQVLRRSGEPDTAVDVLVDMRSQQLRRGGGGSGSSRSSRVLRGFDRASDRVVRAGLSFGYRPLKGVWWLLALGVLGAVVCALAGPDQFRPARAEVPSFNPIVYSFDVLLPIIDFRQQEAWIPESYVQVWTWGVIAAGWVLSTALVVGLTRAMSRT